MTMPGSEISSCDFLNYYYFHLFSFYTDNGAVPSAAFMAWANLEQKGAFCSPHY